MGLIILSVPPIEYAIHFILSISNNPTNIKQTNFIYKIICIYSLLNYIFFYWSLWRCFLRLLLIPGFPSKRNFKRRKKKLINLHTGSGVELKILISPIIRCVGSGLLEFFFYIFNFYFFWFDSLYRTFCSVLLLYHYLFISFLSILTLCRCWLGICWTFFINIRIVYDILFTDPCHNSTQFADFKKWTYCEGIVVLLCNIRKKET